MKDKIRIQMRRHLSQRKIKPSRDEKGFSLIEMLLAIGISGLVLMGTMKFLVETSKVSTIAERQLWISNTRIRIQEIVRTSDGWSSIVSHNPEMNCGESEEEGCRAFQNLRPLRLPIYGNVIDGADPGTGLTNKGDFCHQFDAAQGDPTCPVGIQMKWQMICGDEICKNPQPKITVTFQMNEMGQKAENLSHYNLVLFKDSKLESLYEVCQSMGGTLVGIDCIIPFLEGACSPKTGSFVLGFDEAGKVICGKPDPGSCAPVDVAVGFDTRGALTCSPACP